MESQKEILKLLKAKTNENVREEHEDEPENETKKFYTPTKLVRIKSTQNNESNASRNMVTGVLNNPKNQPQRMKIQSQSQSASQKRQL